METDVDHAERLKAESDAFRAETRWRVRRDDPTRQAHLQELLDAIDDAMRPLRSHIGRLVHQPLHSDRDEKRLRKASAALQYERRQLKKMR
jgi:hypothetical protein